MKEYDKIKTSELAHYGIMGMKWGVRRFQPYSLIPRKSGKGGKETGEAKKASKNNVPVKNVVKKSRNDKSAINKLKVAIDAKTARQRKEKIDKIINSGDAKLVYEHRGELSKQQLNEAIDRINTEARLNSLVSAQNPSTIKKIKDIASKLEDANSLVRTGVNTYKTGEEVVKIAKGLQKSAERKQKEDASAKLLKEIINSGSSAESVRKNQSKLTDRDLENLKKRVKNLDELNKIERGNITTERNDRNRNEDYLRRSLEDIKNTQTSKNKRGKDNPIFNSDYVTTTKLSDDYFDAVVNGYETSKRKKKR